jgi:O-antigen/teichoic acid export membrane protein
LGATRSVAKNTVLLTIGLMSGRLFALLLRKKMTPILGPEGLGILFNAIALTTILLVISRFGLGLLLTREVTKRPGLTLPLFWSAMRLRWAAALGGYGVVALLVFLSGYAPLDRTVVLLLAGGVFIETTSMACDAVLQAHEKVQYQSLGQVLSAFVYFAVGWWLLEAGQGLMGVVWATLASQAVRLVVMAPLMFLRTGPWQWRDSDGATGPGLHAMMRLGLPLFLATTFGVVYTKIDTAMIKAMVGNAAAGIYGQGHQALDVMILVPGLFGTAIFPAMARYAQTSPGDARRLGERALRFMTAGMVPLTLLLTFVAAPIIFWFEKGPRFADSVPLMQIVIWGLPLQAGGVVLSRLLIAAEKERVFVWIGLITMLVNIVLNALLIPLYSYFGAAWATVVSLAVGFGLHAWFLRDTAFLPPLVRPMLGPTLATLVAWGLTVGACRLVFPAWGATWRALPVDGGWVPFLGASALMVVFYLLVLLGLRIIRTGDLDLLRELGPGGRGAPRGD